MNKILVSLCIIAALYVYWEKLPFSPKPAPELAGTYSAEVVLYATEWCGYCAKARKYFQNNNIAFTEYDIEKSSEAKSRYDALKGKGVPLIVINDEIIRGYNPDAIKNELIKSQN